MLHPTISIITVNYNNCKGLEATMCSIAAQNHPGLECIVVDGGSTDGSLDCLTAYVAHITRSISEKDAGMYDAMNKGIKLATGEYLIFLNSGDCFAGADTLTTCVQFMQLQPDADIYYADIYMVDKDTGKRLERFYHPTQLTLDYFRKARPNHQASIIKKTLFDELGLYPAAYKLAGDHWFFLKAFINGKQYRFMDFVMVDYESGGLSMTNGAFYNAEEKQIWEALITKQTALAPAAINDIKSGGFFQRLRRLFE